MENSQLKLEAIYVKKIYGKWKRKMQTKQKREPHLFTKEILLKVKRFHVFIAVFSFLFHFLSLVRQMQQKRVNCTKQLAKLLLK